MFHEILSNVLKVKQEHPYTPIFTYYLFYDTVSSSDYVCIIIIIIIIISVA
jgi:hypothetical protein